MKLGLRHAKTWFGVVLGALAVACPRAAAAGDTVMALGVDGAAPTTGGNLLLGELLAEQKVAKLIAFVEELRRDMPSVPDRVDPVAEGMTEPFRTICSGRRQQDFFSTT